MVKTFVILHGWESDLKKWQPLKQLFQKQGFKVFLPKLPSQKPINTLDYVKWFNQQTKNLKKFYLIGHSFGGQIAINFTAEFPQKVAKLILINSAGIRKKTSPKRLIFWPIAKSGRLLFSLPFFNRWEKPAEKLLYQAARESDYFKATPAMKQTLKIITREDQKDNLKKIKTQTLILWGAKDKITPLAHAKIMDKILSQSTLAVFPDTTHGLPFQQPETVCQKILWFISSN